MPVPVTLDAFERCAIPRDEWNHRAHATVAYLLLRAHPPAEAERRMCEGVQRYNAHHGIEQTETGGYHETLTIAWMRIIGAVIASQGPSDGPDSFLEANPYLLCRTLLRLYYSRDRIMSWEARKGWVEPDLADLPGCMVRDEETRQGLPGHPGAGHPEA